MRLLEIPVYREEGREGEKGRVHARKREGGKGACKEEGGREGCMQGRGR